MVEIVIRVPSKFMMCSGSQRSQHFRASIRTFCLNSLFTGFIHGIDSSITQLSDMLSILPLSNPRRPEIVLSLAWKQFHQHTSSNQIEDLDKAIVHFAESILLSPLSWIQHDPIILIALFSLATALFLRSKVSKQPEDVICATKYLSHLRHQPHEIPTIPRYEVTALLVDTLASQVKSDAGNVMQNIRKMVFLSREILETSDAVDARFIVLIHAVVRSKIDAGVPGQPLDELIEFSRVARKRRPDLLEGHMTFAMCLVYRYMMTSVNNDYEEAASTLDDIDRKSVV